MLRTAVFKVETDIVRMALFRQAVSRNRVPWHGRFRTYSGQHIWKGWNERDMDNMKKPFRFAIMGAGNIANKFCDAVA